MTDPFKTDVIQKSVTLSHLADYLTAECGHDLAVWIDGTVNIIESNRRYSNDDAPIARAKCPGIGNLDATVFSNGFAKFHNERNEYFEIATGRRIGDLSYLIRECCIDGDMSKFYDGLIDQLYESTELPF